VQERHAAAADSDARPLVYELDACAPSRIKGGLDVVGPIRHVMKAGAASREELPDRRVRPERAKQLHVALADAKQHGLHALLLDGLVVLDRHAEPLFVQRDRPVEVLDGNADVVDPAEHGGRV